MPRPACPRAYSVSFRGDRKVGEALVTHPLIKAVGFTGSLGGGRALFNLCAQRPEPIPFFGELGSVNPMFLLPEAMKARAPSLGEGWAASLTMGAGQFCTNPGIAVVIDSSDANSFVQSTRRALEKVAPQVMLTDGIAKAYQDGKAHFDSRNSVKPVLTTESKGREASPNLYETTGEAFLATIPSVRKCSARSALSFASSRLMTWCIWPRALKAN